MPGTASSDSGTGLMSDSDLGRESGPVGAAESAPGGGPREKSEGRPREDEGRLGKDEDRPGEGERPPRKNEQSLHKAEESSPGDAPSSCRAEDWGGPTAEVVQKVQLDFHGAVDARNSVFGASMPPPDAFRRASGRPDEAQIAKDLDRHVPSPEFGDAVRDLREQRVVMLSGETGLGGRLVSVGVIREVTSAPIVILTPSITLRSLAEREYKDKYSYILLDWLPDRASADSEFSWQLVMERVREARTYLVVTTGALAADRRLDGARQIVLSRPPLREVLERRLPHRPSEDIDQLVELIPATWTITSLTRALDRLPADAPAEAILEAFDSASEAIVAKWFTVKADSRRDILAAAALAFLNGIRLRSFESALESLEKEMEASYWPVRKGAGDSKLLNAPNGRGQIFEQSADGIFMLDSDRRVTAGDRYVAFRDPAHRRYVLKQLANGQSIHFWATMERWLRSILESCDEVRVAAGLAILAEFDCDEVESSFLGAWGAYEAGRAGQLTVVYSLWFMAISEDLSAFALRVAYNWCNDALFARKWVAALTFSGQLGIRYPTEAAGRLWHLMNQGDALVTVAQYALATLFVSLTEEGENPGVIILMLYRHLERYDRIGTSSGLELTLDSVLCLVTARRDPAAGPAISAYLYKVRSAERYEQLARLWVALLRRGPYRRHALSALGAALDALSDLGADSGEQIELFVIAVAGAFTRENERAVLHRYPNTAKTSAAVRSILRKLSAGTAGEDIP